MAVETAERPATQAADSPDGTATAEQESRFQRYRVRTGMFAWLAHRLSGVALVGYLIVHIWGLKSLTDPEAFNALIAKYHAPIFKVGEFLLLAAVVYHAMNGLRIVLIDFLGWSPNQKRLFLTLGAVAVVLIAVGGYPSIFALGEYFFGAGTMPTLFL
jgi:succinate dehydrogenase / fumarate reductase cytochrome b subunit